MEIAKAYDPKQAEEHHYQRWESEGFFTPEINEDLDAKKYSIVIPPPNVTGSLHMGHALQHTIMDVLTRRKRMQGYRTLWLPGTDHAGISVQRKVVEQLKKDEHKKPTDIGREEFVRRAWTWKEQYGNTITEQMRREGASVDWTRQRFTMDESLSTAVRNVFCTLYEEGWIYKGLRIVNWCPKDKTVLSDLEVKEEARKDGKLYYLRYPIKSSPPVLGGVAAASADGVVLSLTVATTRPETMLGDTAVAVNPKDERYKDLIGKTILLPLTDREIPIVGDEYVDAEFGTGAVKITPAHDPNDYQVGERHNLERLLIMNEDATMNAAAGPDFEGLDRFVARAKVVERFEELGLLEKVEDYEMTLPVCERCKTVVEPILSDQWFVKMDEMRDMALDLMRSEAVPHFSPQVPHEKVYTAWLENLKDWTISRQLWWGHQIPAWYAPDGTIFVARTEAEAYVQAKAKFGEDVILERDPDVLDTWFSSGLWPFSTLGWPEATQDFETFYPNSVLVTGFDIIFFWVARMTMMAGYFTGKMPFHTVYIHGLVRDENNQKMSKSKNNGIDPLILINKYGVDALRYSLVKEVTGAGQDIRLDYNRKTDESSTVETARNFANKLWNASRFVMLNLDLQQGFGVIDVENLELADRWILSRYYQTILQVREQLDGYSMGEATKSLYEFFWGDFCDWYIELVKSRLQENADPTSRATVQQTLAFVLDGILRLWHPFMPHVTEEIWQLLTYGTSEPSSDRPVLAIQPYPEIDTVHINEELEEQFNLLIGTIRTIRNLRAEAEIKPSVKVKVILQSDSDRERTLLEAGKSYILDLAKVEDLAILQSIDESATEEAIAGVVGTVQAIVSLVGVVDMGQLIAKLERTLSKLEGAIASSQGRLNNEGYVKKAPPEVVETARADLEESLKQQEILKARLAQLQGK